MTNSYHDGKNRLNHKTSPQSPRKKGSGNLAEPFLATYWAGSQHAESARGATMLIPAEIRNFQRFTYTAGGTTWWLLFEYRKSKLTIAGIALAE